MREWNISQMRTATKVSITDFHGDFTKCLGEENPAVDLRTIFEWMFSHFEVGDSAAWNGQTIWFAQRADNSNN